MRKLVPWVCRIGLTVMGAAAHAQASSAMLLSVAGKVQLLNVGQAKPLPPFSRILDGDRLKLGDDGKITLIYGRTGRQETWSGGGVIAAGENECALLSGKSAVEVKQLPTQLALQMARTPQVDSSGKAGMLRLRANGAGESLATLEDNYRKLRQSAASEDRNPEIYWLSALFEADEFDRLGDELALMEKTYPGDPTLQALSAIYTKAINIAHQGKR